MNAASNTTNEVSITPKPRSRLLLRNRDYTNWWIGGTVSDFGSALSVIAYPLLILAITGSAARAGTVGAAVSIGGLVTMLFGGVLADRLSRRTVMTVGPLVQALAVGTVVISVVGGHVGIVYITFVGFIQGLVGGLAGGAELATLRRVVPEDQLPTAFAQFQGRSMAIRLAGPSVGGFLFSLAPWVPFLVDALSFLAGALGVAVIRRPLGPDLDELGVRESVFASIGGGLRFIRQNAYLRFLTVWVAIANARNAGLLLLVIALMHGRHSSGTLIGAVSSLGAVGGIVGSLFAERIAERMPGRRIIIVMSWIAVLVFVGIALVPAAWMIAALLASMMFFMGPINVVFGTYEARIIPDALMGRVSSAINFGTASIQWLGPLGAALLAEMFGPEMAALAIAGFLALVAIGTHFAKGPRALEQPLGELTESAT